MKIIKANVLIFLVSIFFLSGCNTGNDKPGNNNHGNDNIETKILASKSITVDGSNADWYEIDPIASDPSNDNIGNDSTDIINFSVVHDSEKLYLLLEVNGLIALPHTPNKEYSHYETAIHLYSDEKCQDEIGFVVVNNFTHISGMNFHRLDYYVNDDRDSIPTEFSYGGAYLETSFALSHLPAESLSLRFNPYVQSFDNAGVSTIHDSFEDRPINICFLRPAEIQHFTLSFDSSGGSEVAPITQGFGTAVVAPTNPTRPGYTFMGWSPAIPSTIPAEGQTFTAQWQVNQYTLAFDTAGGSVVAAITGEAGTSVTAPANPTRTGYTFMGWSPAIPSTIPPQNQTLTAQWQINQYTLTFNTAGGSTVNAITQDFGTSVTAPANPTRTGYTFTSWSPAIPSTIPPQNQTLTAQWQINQYTLTFDTAGGSTVNAITQDFGTSVTAPANPTRTGYTFMGWSPAIPSTMPEQNLTLMAQWGDLPILRSTILNDTGIDWCSNESTNNLDCPVATHPEQDGDFGRDALARRGELTKIGGGSAGFDYTKLDANGQSLANQDQAWIDSGNEIDGTRWSCVHDNHTGLIWEVKVNETGHLRHKDHSYTWYNPDQNTNGGNAGTQNGGTCTGSDCDTSGFMQAVNTQGLCGANDWRVPTRMELHSLTHFGRIIPSIDSTYFPNSDAWYFWSASPSYAGRSGNAWPVNFGYGYAYWVNKSLSFRLRLVRGGQ